jgi:hypothetical protein
LLEGVPSLRRHVFVFFCLIIRFLGILCDQLRSKLGVGSTGVTDAPTDVRTETAVAVHRFLSTRICVNSVALFICFCGRLIPCPPLRSGIVPPPSCVTLSDGHPLHLILHLILLTPPPLVLSWSFVHSTLKPHSLLFNCRPWSF